MIYTGLGRVGEIADVKANGGADVAEVYGGIGESDPIYYKQREMVGTSPMQFKALGLTLKDYRIYGETRKDGTPSPDMPVDVVGCGARTGNLWNEDYIGINTDAIYRPLFVGDGVFTLSTDFERNGNITDIFLLSGNVSSGISSDANGAYQGRNITARSVNGYITIAYRANARTGSDSLPYCKTMLNLGSTALPYEPYGYKIPVTIGNTTTPIYIGSDPLYRIGDYADEVDFGNQRIIRRVNPTTMQPYETPITSTVTIPQLTTAFGDNTLTVDTVVKPSAVSITGNVKPTGYGQLLDANDVDIRDSNSTPIFIRG